MKRSQNAWLGGLLFGLFLLPAAATAQLAHHENITIGRSGSGQLKVLFDFDEVQVLPVAVDPQLHGWAHDHPALVNAEEDEPREDFFMLADNATIVFEVVAFDPAFKGWTEQLDATFQKPADTVMLGAPDFHYHPWWNIDSADPNFNPNQTEWHATFHILDRSGTYAMSDDYTVTFSNVPEPASLAMLAAGFAMFVRRR